VLLLLSTIVGFSFNIPNTAASLNHDVGNVDINILTDYGRILQPISTSGPLIYQTARDGVGFGFIGLVIDHDDYGHTPGAEDIAECYDTWPYPSGDDFQKVQDIAYLINTPTTQKSFGSFKNIGGGYPDDLRIDQTAWSIENGDWAIIQWRMVNIKGVAINNVHIGLEVPISKVGATGGGGVGGDSGDDIDAWDGANSVYYASDNAGAGTTIAFSSAIDSDPINHYYSEDYEADYSSEYIDFFANETWLYNRLHAASATATDGVNPGNITTTVGWNSFSIPAGESRTVTMIIAIQSDLAGAMTAISDAKTYYNDVATSFVLTEVRDSGSASPQFEVYNFGRQPTPTGSLSFTNGAGALTGTWSSP
jgi:hypothetical protein